MEYSLVSIYYFIRSLINTLLQLNLPGSNVSLGGIIIAVLFLYTIFIGLGLVRSKNG